MVDQVNTTGLEPHPASPARRMPTVAGECPACGNETLFLGTGGYVTCANLECPKPEAASELLEAMSDG